MSETARVGFSPGATGSGGAPNAHSGRSAGVPAPPDPPPGHPAPPGGACTGRQGWPHPGALSQGVFGEAFPAVTRLPTSCLDWGGWKFVKYFAIFI